MTLPPNICIRGNPVLSGAGPHDESAAATSHTHACCATIPNSTGASEESAVDLHILDSVSAGSDCFAIHPPNAATNSQASPTQHARQANNSSNVQKSLEQCPASSPSRLHLSSLEYRQQLDAFENKITVMTDHTAELRARIAAVEAERDSVTSKLSEVTARLAAERSTVAALTKQLQQQQVGLAPLEKQGGVIMPEITDQQLRTAREAMSPDDSGSCRAAAAAAYTSPVMLPRAPAAYSTPVISGFSKPWPAMSSSQTSCWPSTISSAATLTGLGQSSQSSTIDSDPAAHKQTVVQPGTGAGAPGPSLTGPPSYTASAQLQGWVDRHGRDCVPLSLQTALEQPAGSAPVDAGALGNPRTTSGLSIHIVSSGVPASAKHPVQQGAKSDSHIGALGSQKAVRGGQRRHPGARAQHSRMRHPHLSDDHHRIQRQRPKHAADVVLTPTTEYPSPANVPVVPGSVPKVSAFAAMSQIPF